MYKACINVFEEGLCKYKLTNTYYKIFMKLNKMTHRPTIHTNQDTNAILIEIISK